MKKYVSPEVEFVEIGENNNVDIITASPYNCPNNYGSTCTGNPYGGY